MSVQYLLLLYCIDYAVVYVGGKRDDRGIVIKGSEKPRDNKTWSYLT